MIQAGLGATIMKPDSSRPTGSFKNNCPMCNCQCKGHYKLCDISKIRQELATNEALQKQHSSVQIISNLGMSYQSFHLLRLTLHVLMDCHSWHHWYLHHHRLLRHLHIIKWGDVTFLILLGFMANYFVEHDVF